MCDSAWRPALGLRPYCAWHRTNEENQASPFPRSLLEKNLTVVTVVAGSLRTYIKLKKVSSCYIKNIKYKIFLFLFCNCLDPYRYMIEDSRAIYCRISMYRACLFYLSCILIVILIGFGFIYLACTTINSVNMYFRYF